MYIYPIYICTIPHHVFVTIVYGHSLFNYYISLYFYMREIILCWHISLWWTLLSLILYRFLNVAALSMTLSFLMAKQYSIFYLDIDYVGSAARNMWVQMSFIFVVFGSLRDTKKWNFWSNGSSSAKVFDAPYSFQEKLNQVTFLPIANESFLKLCVELIFSKWNSKHNIRGFIFWRVFFYSSYKDSHEG